MNRNVSRNITHQEYLEEFGPQIHIAVRISTPIHHPEQQVSPLCP